CSSSSCWDVRQDLKPLLTGNLTFGAFFVGMLTRVFNKVDRLRGGSGFPPISRSTLKKTPLLTYGLAPGDSVRVLGIDRIAATIDAGSRRSCSPTSLTSYGRRSPASGCRPLRLGHPGRALEMQLDEPLPAPKQSGNRCSPG